VSNAGRQDDCWANAPPVFITLPSCPHCGAVGYKRVRTEQNGDGSSTKKVRCSTCTLKYKIVMELPETGNWEYGIGDTEDGGSPT
jgi:hypothetical protein